MTMFDLYAERFEVVANLFAKIMSVFAYAGRENDCVWKAAERCEIAGDQFCNLIRKSFKSSFCFR